MGRQSHGYDPTLVHSSIALLQERFRQLQRVKEMREERQLLRMLTSKPKQFISNSKSSMTTTNRELTPTVMTSFSYPELMTIPSTTMTPPSPTPPTHSQVSLSLWPSSSSPPHDQPRETISSVETFLEPETPPVSMTLWRKNTYQDCDGSDPDSGVDTSLHL